MTLSQLISISILRSGLNKEMFSVVDQNGNACEQKLTIPYKEVQPCFMEKLRMHARNSLRGLCVFEIDKKRCLMTSSSNCSSGAWSPSVSIFYKISIILTHIYYITWLNSITYRCCTLLKKVWIFGSPWCCF